MADATYFSWRRSSFLEFAALQQGRCAISYIHPNVPTPGPPTSRAVQVNLGVPSPLTKGPLPTRLESRLRPVMSGTITPSGYLPPSITTVPPGKSAGRRRTPSFPGMTFLPLTRAIFTGPLPLTSSRRRPAESASPPERAGCPNKAPDGWPARYARSSPRGNAGPQRADFAGGPGNQAAEGADVPDCGSRRFLPRGHRAPSAA